MAKQINLNWRFFPKQANAFLSRAQRRVIAAGRRGGKGKTGSRVIWEKVLENPATSTSDPKQILVTATTYRQLMDVNKLALDREMPPGLATWHSGDKCYRCNNGPSGKGDGTQVLLRSIDSPDSLRGLGEFIVFYWGDEFSYYPNRVWDEVISYILMDNNAPALFTGTPNGLNNFYKFFQRGIDGPDYVPGWESFSWSSYENPYISKDALRETLEGLPDGVKQQEVFAKFLDDLGGVFRNIKRIIAGDYEAPIVGEQYRAGLDLGKHKDFTVLKIANKNTRHVVYSDRWNRTDWETQVGELAAILKRYNNATTFMDSTGVGDAPFDLLVNRGCRVVPVSIHSNEIKRELVESLVVALAEESFTMPEDPVTMNEMKIFQADRTPSGLTTYSAPEGYHDDCVSALMLLNRALGPVPKHTGTPMRLAENGPKRELAGLATTRDKP